MRLSCRRMAVLAALCLMSGCAERWVKPDGTPQERDATLSRCAAASLAANPPRPTFGEVIPASSRIERQCVGKGKNEFCWYETRTVAPYYATTDLNAEGRRAARHGCMAASGWHLADQAPKGAAP